MAAVRGDDREPRQPTPLMRWLEAKRAARGSESHEAGVHRSAPTCPKRAGSPANRSRRSAADERMGELDAQYLNDPNHFSRGSLNAAEGLVQSATIAGHHGEAHGHRAAIAHEKRRLRLRELRAQSHLSRVRQLRTQRYLDARRRGNLASRLLPKRRQRGCSGRPRGRTHRVSRITRAGPSGRSSDGPGEPGDEEPPAGRREVRSPTTPGRLRR